MRAMVAQLKSESEDLQQVSTRGSTASPLCHSVHLSFRKICQVTPCSDSLFQVIASVLRNLSWRADVNSKKTLREVGSVRALMGCALEVQKVKVLLFFC